MLRILRSLTLCTACLLLAGGALAAAPAAAPPTATAPPDVSAGTAPAGAPEPTAPLTEPPLPDFLLAVSGDGAAGGDCPPVLSGDGAQQPVEAGTCGGCTSPQGFCTSGIQCRNWCLDLVGEVGFCNSDCGCCVCAYAPPPPPEPEPLPDDCVSVCLCNGVLEYGPCDDRPLECREVNCI